MTLAHALDLLRADLVHNDVIAPGRRLMTCEREALRTVVAALRPLGVQESGAKRELARTSAASAEEKGMESMPASPRGGSATIRPAAPSRCAECGTELSEAEIARQVDVQGSKYSGMCDECCYLKAGLR